MSRNAWVKLSRLYVTRALQRLSVRAHLVVVWEVLALLGVSVVPQNMVCLLPLRLLLLPVGQKYYGNAITKHAENFEAMLEFLLGGVLSPISTNCDFQHH